jgi:hypothetical protein
MLYVLTTKLEGQNGYGPVAVVDDEHVANEWIRAGEQNDWVPLELNDLSTTDMAAKTYTRFKPVDPQTRNQQTQHGVERTTKNLQEANKLIEEALKRKHRVRSHARRAARKAAAIPQALLVQKFYEGRAQNILNDYLTERGQNEQDPEIYDFLDYIKTKYRGVPEDEYSILVDVLYAKYKEMFGNK